MTDGILLAETQTDPLLKAYDTIIIDEAHERSLNIDFLLGYLRQILPRRPDLKIVVTSATIDAQRFADHFASRNGPAPVIMVSGRMFSVEQRYRPMSHPAADLLGSGRLQALALAIVLSLLLMSAGAVESAGSTPTGIWQTTSDMDGKPRGLVRIAEKDGIFFEAVVAVLVAV